MLKDSIQDFKSIIFFVSVITTAEFRWDTLIASLDIRVYLAPSIEYGTNVLSNVSNELGGTGSGGQLGSCIEGGILIGEGGWERDISTMLPEGGRILIDRIGDHAWYHSIRF